MSVIEIVVVITGLFLGYWVVSKFLFSGSSSTMSPGGQSQERDRATTQAREGPSVPWEEVLNVSPNASIDEIRRAYKTLMGQYHPDKVASLGDELKRLAEQKSREITQAYREALRARGADT